MRGASRGRKKYEKNGGKFVNCQIVINFVKRAAEVLKEKDLLYKIVGEWELIGKVESFFFFLGITTGNFNH